MVKGPVAQVVRSILVRVCQKQLHTIGFSRTHIPLPQEEDYTMSFGVGLTFSEVFTLQLIEV